MHNNSYSADPAANSRLFRRPLPSGANGGAQPCGGDPGRGPRHGANG